MIRSEFETFEPAAWQEDGILKPPPSRTRRTSIPHLDRFRAGIKTAITAAAVSSVMFGSSAVGLSVRSAPSAQVHCATLVERIETASAETLRFSRTKSDEAARTSSDSPDTAYWAKLIGRMKMWKHLPDDDPSDDIDPLV
jgi:hypothetical protein